MDKRASAADVIAELRSGMTIGIGGWGAQRKPMALVRAICRSDVSDLTVVSFGGPDVGMLCAAGKVRRVVFAFVSLDAVGLEPHFRLAREHGAVAATEYDEGMLRWGLYAASLRLPYLPTRAGLGTDLLEVNGDLAVVSSPFDDAGSLVAVRAIPLDVALVHVHQATADGIGQVAPRYDPFFDHLMCRAAERTFLSCEQIVPLEQLHATGCEHTYLTYRGIVDGLVELPGGAHPTACAPAYATDEAHLRHYAEATGPDWSSYAESYIELDSHEAYLAAAGMSRAVDRQPA